VITYFLAYSLISNGLLDVIVCVLGWCRKKERIEPAIITEPKVKPYIPRSVKIHFYFYNVIVVYLYVY